MRKKGTRKRRTNFRTNLWSVAVHPRRKALSLRLDSLPRAEAPDWNLCESRHAGTQHEGLRFHPHPQLVLLRLSRRAPSPAHCAPSPDRGEAGAPKNTWDMQRAKGHYDRYQTAQEAPKRVPKRPSRKPRQLESTPQEGPRGLQDDPNPWENGGRLATPKNTWEMQRARGH